MELPSYQEIKSLYPLLPAQYHFIEKSRQTVRAILNGTDSRLLLVVGPCSIHDPLSAKDFASHLRQISSTIDSQFFLVMRVYCEKPRTASGWTGYLYDPLLNGSYATQLGVKLTRQLFLELTDMQVPIATEFLDPLTAYYYEDLITWGSIGARTASSPTHRHLASGLKMPIGFKNGIAGNVCAAVNGALAASISQTFMRICDKSKLVLTQTTGNPDAHIILRGGESGPNYDPSSVSNALADLERIKLPVRLVIDCSHGNSGKKHDLQLLVFQSIIHQIVEGNSNIRGLMLESHLYAGNQALNHVSELKYGISITDPCLDWHSTAHLLSWGAEHLQKQLFTLRGCF